VQTKIIKLQRHLILHKVQHCNKELNVKHLSFESLRRHPAQGTTVEVKRPSANKDVSSCSAT